MSVGLTLAVSVFVADTGTVAAAPSAPNPSSAVAADYTVRPGDSLVGIANRYGIRVSKLLQANDLELTDTIYPGDVLTLPEGAQLIAAQPAAQPTAQPTTAQPTSAQPPLRVLRRRRGPARTWCRPATHWRSSLLATG